MRPTYRLLDQVTVLDLSRTLPGPFCTWLLAGLGARVVSISPPGESRTPGLSGDVRDRVLWRNKRRLTLNLKTEAGRALCLRLAERADAVVEDFRPGVAARLGVDWPAVRAVNPRAVYCSITAFGQAGPYRGLPAHDLNCLALAGMLDLTGERDGPPVIPATQVADLASGSAAALAILAALIRRGASGEGCYVDAAMLDATLVWLLVPLLSRWRGAPPARGDWLLGGAEPFYRVYRCADGRYLSVGCLEPWLWRNLLRALEIDEREATHERLEALFATRTRDEWWARLREANTCVAPVLTLEEAARDPQIAGRDVLGTAQAPDLGLPFALPEDGGEPGRPGGPPGGDAAVILGELGLGEAELERLRVEGVI